MDSWRLRVQHHTGYRYHGSVSDSYNEVRMTPRSSSHQTVLEARVEVEPRAHLSRFHDYWGTVVHAFDLHEPHDELTVVGTSLVETRGGDGWLEPSGDASWADLRDGDLLDRHCEYLAPSRLVPADADLAAAADEGVGSAATPAAAVEAAATLVRDRLEYQRGTTTVQSSAVDAWHARRGVCQDFVHLTLGLLRHVGIPTRYVSGYLHPSAAPALGEECVGESHAWVEVWTGRWRPLDPTSGDPVGVRHVVVARGRDYADVTPLRGIYSGDAGADTNVAVTVTRVA